MNMVLKNKTLGLLVILASLYILLAVIGGIRTYSPVPFWDMWDGYINFLLHIQENDLSIWWSQHNEHRIFLSRILFWADNYFFKGLGSFLIFFNFLLGGLISYCFFNILKTSLPNKEHQLLRYYLFFFILALTFSWTQVQNYSWGFQSQFFLAYLLPLTSFYCLYLSSKREKNTRSLFLFSCLAGTASAGTMANGVIALPLMMVLAIFLKLEWRKIVFLGVLSGIILYAYFYNYMPISYHASLKDSLLHHPFGLIKFIFLFFGGPFFYMSGRIMIVGILAGLFFIGSFLYFIYRYAKKRDSSALQMPLFAFIFYIGITAFCIAGARLNISLPTESRYMTPVFMAWSAWLVLYVLNTQKLNKQKIFSIFIVALIFLLPWQVFALKSNSNLFEREVAVLALKMQIKDQKQISFVHHNMHVIDIAKKAAENHLSIFNTPRFKSVGEFIGQVETPCSTRLKCLGNLDKISFIEDCAYINVKGWIYDPITQNVPLAICILDQDKKIIGYALTGERRKDIKKAISPKALYAGFSGYMLAEYADKAVTLKGIMPDCHFVATPECKYEHQK
jgi:hypothetical protein